MMGDRICITTTGNQCELTIRKAQERGSLLQDFSLYSFDFAYIIYNTISAIKISILE